MDSSDFPASRSPQLRKELQGPRPPALKLSKDSYKIKKPTVAPPQQAQPRLPVIIYTVSPKVIHTNPDDFMTLVQRLTGASSASSPTSNFNPFNVDCSAITPAARYATTEKAKSPKEKQQLSGGMQTVEDIEMDRVVGRQNVLPGILSPGPASLPPIQPNCFSILSDPNTVSFFHDLSPVLHGNRNFIEGSFMPSPSTFVSPSLPSPVTPSIDLFNNFSACNNFLEF